MSWIRAVRITGSAAAIILAGCASGQVMGHRMASVQDKDDIVHLGGGGEVRGTIVERIAGTSVSVRGRDGTVLVLPDADIGRIEQRSMQGAAAPGMPVARMSDSALVGQWVRMETYGGPRQGRVVRIDADTVVVREHPLSLARKVARPAIASALLSRRESRKTLQVAAEAGLVSGGVIGLLVGAFDAKVGLRLGAIAGATGAAMGAVGGSLVVEHGSWQKLEMTSDATHRPATAAAWP